MSNNAAAVLIFPIALATANQMGVNPMPFVIAITVAASYGFATPIGYQTHLMVQGAGGYKFTDYLKVGPLLNLICFVVAVLLIPIFWKF
jgi:di/tricarboxylate transporter